MRPQKLIHILIGLVCIGFLPKAQAVSPPPDGGYPGGNTAEGQAALLSLTTGGFNTAVGFLSLRTDTTGQLNTAIGAGTLLANTADENTAMGAGALLSNITGSLNTANGAFALYQNTEGTDNTAVGVSALNANTTGIANTALGSNAGTAVTTANNVICVGANVGGENVSNSCYIGNIFGVTSLGATGVLVNTDGKLGTTTSSRRFKEDIKPMERTSEALFALKPVTFHYKKAIDPRRTSQCGLVAEDVEKVNPDLIVRDKEGKPYSVRYDQVNAMLLNEFLKEHRKVETLEATVAQQRKDLETTITELKNEMKRFAARSEEQDAKIQKVSAQAELDETASQRVAAD
jgi:hypothetical protein